MNVILWMWVFVPCFLAFICVGIVCVLTEIFQARKILQMKTGQGREYDRTGVRLLTGGLADEIDSFYDSYMTLVGHVLQGLEDGDILWIRFYARQRYFGIYESRTGEVLRLSPEVRRAVIQAYTAARHLLDGLSQYTMLLNKPGNKSDVMLQTLAAETRQLKTLHRQMCLATEQALAMLRAGLIPHWFPVRPQ
ncbi:hypothetical protein DRE43_28670 [Salmonella enterica subsp. enterica serovar Java]|uniref:Uncharacterized protein n=1 Tax=Salmonella enterica TaxID=28901 RepID=A0A403MZY9_SALER|nr:hypothetical protein [Salmonella enterica subsp. diarizonae]EAU1515979.1 hypothetical protein [Salmonella enterica]EBQ9442448.1 hypothetical protein [Salmonella enterica subsp. enterica serovar Cerro]EBX2068521.1 hypothetical protein [Salmonella enterica subsp. enterica serovar Java]EDO1590769.1 hypothetical protein [Salmonella enterica subsp. enterica serovar Adelaide]EDW6120919.1 hypothetical protein [Salmonella enterica subsp. salamae]EHE8612842.1 hypothetical protein [Salmonella enteri